MRRLIPTIRAIFTSGPFEIFVSVSLLALDSNRVARTSRVFKIGIEREFVISVLKPMFLLETNKELLKVNGNALLCYACSVNDCP